jgi:hypothetical protein
MLGILLLKTAQNTGPLHVSTHQEGDVVGHQALRHSYITGQTSPESFGIKLIGHIEILLCSYNSLML